VYFPAPSPETCSHAALHRFRIIELAPDFISPWNIHQTVTFRHFQIDGNSTSAGDFGDEHAKHLSGGSAERFGHGIGLCQQRLLNATAKEHGHVPTVPHRVPSSSRYLATCKASINDHNIGFKGRCNEENSAIVGRTFLAAFDF
jgi:hypothetical protein